MNEQKYDGVRGMRRRVVVGQCVEFESGRWIGNVALKPSTELGARALRLCTALKGNSQSGLSGAE